MGTLSVRENFHFSAALRLDKSVTKKERDARVENVIKELALTHCADTKVTSWRSKICAITLNQLCSVYVLLIYVYKKKI